MQLKLGVAAVLAACAVWTNTSYATQTHEIDACKPFTKEVSGSSKAAGKDGEMVGDDPSQNFLIMTSGCSGRIKVDFIHEGYNAAENAEARADIERAITVGNAARGCQSGGKWDDIGFNFFHVECHMTYMIDPGFESRDARVIRVRGYTNKVASHTWNIKVSYEVLGPAEVFAQNCKDNSAAWYSTDNYMSDPKNRRAAVIVNGDTCGGVFSLNTEKIGQIVISDKANPRLPVVFCQSNNKSCPRSLPIEPGKSYQVIHYSLNSVSYLSASWYPRGPKPTTVDFRCDAKLGELCYFKIYFAARDMDEPMAPRFFTMQGNGTTDKVSDVVPTRDEYCACMGGNTPPSLEMCKGTYQGKQCHRGIISDTNVNH